MESTFQLHHRNPTILHQGLTKRTAGCHADRYGGRDGAVSTVFNFFANDEVRRAVQAVQALHSAARSFPRLTQLKPATLHALDTAHPEFEERNSGSLRPGFGRQWE